MQIPTLGGRVVSVAVAQHKNFVGGEWVESAGGETMEVLNPATGEVIAEVPRSTEADVDRAVAAAEKAWVENVGKPAVIVDNLRFFAGAARVLEGKAAAEYVQGYTSITSTRSRRRCRTAASRSPATARISRSTRWRSTPASSTSS